MADPHQYKSILQRMPQGLRTVALISLIVITIITAWSGLWLSLALVAKGEIANATENWSAKGYKISFTSYQLSGYPLRVAIHFENPSLAAPNNGFPIVWEPQRLVLSANTWDWSTIFWDASGSNRLQVDNGRAIATFSGIITQFSGETLIEEPGLKNLRVLGSGISMQEEGSGKGFHIKRLETAWSHYHNSAGQGQTVGLSLQELVLFGMQTGPFGHQLEKLSLQADITDPVPGTVHEEALRRWRDSGGIINLQNLDLNLGPLSLQASGTLALDGMLQPIASLTTRTQGFFETVDILAKQGWVPSGQALTAKLVLGVLAQATGDGAAVINLPVTVQEQRLYAGPVRLAKVPRIQWP